MKMEAEIGVMWPPDQGCSEISEAGREEFLIDLSVCVCELSCYFGFRILAFRAVRITHSFCFKRCRFLMQVGLWQQSQHTGTYGILFFPFMHLTVLQCLSQLLQALPNGQDLPFPFPVVSADAEQHLLSERKSTVHLLAQTSKHRSGKPQVEGLQEVKVSFSRVRHHPQAFEMVWSHCC